MAGPSSVPTRTTSALLAAKRLELVASLYLRHLPVAKIHEALNDQFGPVAYGTVKNMITRVRKRWRKKVDEARENVDESRAAYVAELEHLWRMALSMNDVRGGLAVAKELALIKGVDLTTPLMRVDASLEDMGHDDVVALRMALEAAQGVTAGEDEADGVPN